MMRIVSTISLALAWLVGGASPRASAQAASGPPNSDVFLVRIQRAGDTVSLGAAQNITRRPGYDNQPAFLTDASGLLYTAIDSSGQADIWRYELATRRQTRLTRTPESEYSPTMMPGSERFSVVRVERDSTQRLWSFRLDGTDPQLVLESLAPIGYHAWLEPSRLAVYVLGSPSTLQVVRSDGSDADVRATHIGRTIQRVPAQDWYSFVQLDSTRTPWIVAQPFEGGAVSDLVRVPDDDEFYAWGPDGTLFSASKGAIVRWNGVSGDGSAWLPIPSMARFDVKNISRLAVSPDGRWLAFVAEPATP